MSEVFSRHFSNGYFQSSWGAQYLVDLPALMVVSIAAVPILISGRSVVRLEGALLLLIYISYISVLFFLVPGWFGSPATE